MTRAWRRARGWILALFVAWALAEARRSPVTAQNPPSARETSRAAGRPRQRAGARCLPAGVLWRGRSGSPRPDEGPPHRVTVGAFCIDETLVTRARFGDFVARTGYRTDGERGTLPMESLEGFEDWAWQRAPSASWRRPFSVENEDTRAFLHEDAPVVMVSFHDAQAYCAHHGGRVPTEAEWEYAMRAGRHATRFPWGDSPLDARGAPRLNYWQGASHARNDRADGYVYVSPVRAFAPNAWGLYDPVGNVWQWTADRYDPRAYERVARGAPPETPDAGAGSRDERVVRGGSWWCGACTCEGYGLWYRGHNRPADAFSNLGFRCAYPAPIDGSTAPAGRTVAPSPSAARH